MRNLAENLPNTTNLEDVRQTIARMKPDLSIARVPPDTRKKFIEFAAQFASESHPSPDYGMALKWLIDFCFPAQSELEGRLVALEGRIAVLETKPEVNSHSEDKEEEKHFQSPSEALKRLKSEVSVNG